MPRRDEIEPLTVDVRRIHFNVGKAVVKKLEAAREGLSHSIRGVTMEQVLEAAVDLLLEKQARARGQVKRARATTDLSPRESAPPLALIPTEPPPPRRTGPRETITAAVRRAVWERDGGRCCWPLDGGGVCGSTQRLELDHIVPWARFGGTMEDNLRLTCRRHNALAARQAFGARWMGRYQGAGRCDW